MSFDRGNIYPINSIEVLLRWEKKNGGVAGRHFQLSQDAGHNPAPGSDGSVLVARAEEARYVRAAWHEQELILIDRRVKEEQQSAEERLAPYMALFDAIYRYVPAYRTVVLSLVETLSEDGCIDGHNTRNLVIPMPTSQAQQLAKEAMDKAIDYCTWMIDRNKKKLAELLINAPVAIKEAGEEEQRLAFSCAIYAPLQARADNRRKEIDKIFYPVDSNGNDLDHIYFQE